MTTRFSFARTTPATGPTASSASCYQHSSTGGTSLVGEAPLLLVYRADILPEGD